MKMTRAKLDAKREEIADLFNHGLNDDEVVTQLVQRHGDGPTLLDKLMAVIRDLMTNPIKCRVVVSMHGGTIEEVVHDNEQVEITDVVFLEDRKYQSEEPEFFVKAGQFEDQFVYTHMSSDLPAAGAFEPVMLAAQQRIRYAEETENLRK